MRVQRPRAHSNKHTTATLWLGCLGQHGCCTTGGNSTLLLLPPLLLLLLLLLLLPPPTAAPHATPRHATARTAGRAQPPPSVPRENAHMQSYRLPP
jgi:hypothetical protein